MGANPERRLRDFTEARRYWIGARCASRVPISRFMWVPGPPRTRIGSLILAIGYHSMEPRMLDSRHGALPVAGHWALGLSTLALVLLSPLAGADSLSTAGLDPRSESLSSVLLDQEREAPQ